MKSPGRAFARRGFILVYSARAITTVSIATAITSLVTALIKPVQLRTRDCVLFFLAIAWPFTNPSVFYHLPVDRLILYLGPPHVSDDPAGRVVGHRTVPWPCFGPLCGGQKSF